MNDLTQYHLETLKYMKKLIEEGWNISTMYETFDYTTDFEEGWKKLSHTQFFDCDDYEGCFTTENNTYKLLYDNSDVECGKCVSYYSEYNDQSGDDIYESYECSCLLIWK